MKMLYLVRKLNNKEHKVEPYKDDAGRVVAFADIEDARKAVESMKPGYPPQSWCVWIFSYMQWTYERNKQAFQKCYYVCKYSRGGSQSM